MQMVVNEILRHVVMPPKTGLRKNISHFCSTFRSIEIGTQKRLRMGSLYYTCGYAARNGYFETLRWARENGCPELECN